MSPELPFGRQNECRNCPHAFRARTVEVGENKVGYLGWGMINLYQKKHAPSGLRPYLLLGNQKISYYPQNDDKKQVRISGTHCEKFQQWMNALTYEEHASEIFLRETRRFLSYLLVTTNPNCPLERGLLHWYSLSQRTPPPKK